VTLRLLLAVAAVAGLTVSATADAVSPYAGEEHRAISTLSDSDVADLLGGKGWGFAKPAELNGYPGPAHVLQLEDRLGLTAEQRTKVEAIFARMAADARSAGARFIEAERAVDAAFKAGTVDAAMVKERIEAAEALRAELRRIHLAAHLETAPILTAEQRHAYITLRGYDMQTLSGHGGHHHPMPNAH
jgi:Spy/CpxP family protein refolding chaperone